MHPAVWHQASKVNRTRIFCAGMTINTNSNSGWGSFHASQALTLQKVSTCLAVQQGTQVRHGACQSATGAEELGRIVAVVNLCQTNMYMATWVGCEPVLLDMLKYWQGTKSNHAAVGQQTASGQAYKCPSRLTVRAKRLTASSVLVSDALFRSGRSKICSRVTDGHSACELYNHPWSGAFIANVTECRKAVQPAWIYRRTPECH